MNLQVVNREARSAEAPDWMGKPPKVNDAKFLRDCGIKRY